MQKFYILNIVQYFLGYFEILICFKVLQRIYREENTRIKHILQLSACGVLAAVEAINRSIRLYSIVLIIFLMIVSY